MPEHRMWCPVDSLSGHSVCPQDPDLCPHYTLLFSEYTGPDEMTEVYHCELVTASMLLNRCQGQSVKKVWPPRFPQFQKMRQFLYDKYFQYLSRCDD